ncbi:MAG: FKBP-type peptidyl-prolyl cis-trans isomerase [Bacteroidota bacterium]|nr:FKBP-type peptidyl-prolyl cis-trans isomerase [Bacteroidota bacterium]
MKKNHLHTIALFLGAALLIVSCRCSDKTTKDESPDINMSEMETLKDSASFALGVQIAQSFKQQGIAEKIDQDIFMAVLKKQFANEEALVDMNASNQLIQKFMSQASKTENEPKIEEGKKFLETNAKREEVNVTESGLQYEVLNEGDGEKPGPNNKVKVHYEGTLLDGTVFDSSYERGEPIEFPLNGVIKGWQEGLQLMKTGAKYKLYIPYNLGYGERGARGAIGPYETLIFEVELLDIVE